MLVFTALRFLFFIKAREHLAILKIQTYQRILKDINYYDLYEISKVVKR